MADGRHLSFRWWVLAFFRSWNSEGLLLLRSKLFLLSPAPIHTNTRGGDQNMQGIGSYALKISMIEKTPTPHHRKNAALPFFSISIPISISKFPKISISISKSIFWKCIFQYQYQNQYFETVVFNIKININMTKILTFQNFSKFCPMSVLYSSLVPIRRHVPINRPASRH